MFVTIAVHHPHPDHREDFVAFMERVIDQTNGADGLLEFTSWMEFGGDRLIGMARWDSPQAFHAALPTITGLSGERRPEWTVAPDELLTLDEVQAPA
jgi:hypothetical protein